MIKVCKVLLNNEDVTVIEYDGDKVQIPSIHKDVKEIKINFTDGKYLVADNEELPKKVENTNKSKNKD